MRQKWTQREAFAWASLLIFWIGMNVVLIYELVWWNSLFDSRIKASWLTRYRYASREWALPANKDEARRKLKYRVLEPSATSDSQPLLIYLHGSGERGSDNTIQLNGLPSQIAESRWRRMCPGFVVAPQCPANSDWNRELPALIGLIESWRNNPRVDKQRIYVTGLSMGGYGTWNLVAAKPDWFAAALPICGGGDPLSAVRLVNVPIWAVHGSADKVVPVEQTRSMIEAIRAVGGTPHFTELSGIGHDCWSATYRNPNGALTWMFRQVNMRCDECR
jgi:predicted peptidase